MRAQATLYSFPCMPISELKHLRERRGWTQRELARESGVGLATIRRAEQGTSTTRSDALVKLADALDVSIDELVGRQIAA